ncbi:hypothetical protein C8F04DRAFT_1265534 [Mycena alexandri]|uniref:Uncharacterized protein n=1 Tax=Mycena alexandri TaxID=1745969 RepID=A0AAD6SN80_9AGAR|nr:hypothetical protein C8F04DRAFT_1265534 [Mycena alexandri]
MPGTFPLVRSNTAISWNCADECEAIKSAWHRRDRSAIRSYADFLKRRRFMEGKLAASNAVASIRAAHDDKWRFRDWLGTLKHRPPNPPPEPPSPGGWALEWALQKDIQAGWGRPSRDWQPDPWDPNRSREWKTPWNTYSPGVRDPDWDGVTPVPKSPGKRKRQRQRKRARVAELEAEKVAWVAMCRAEASLGWWEEQTWGGPKELEDAKKLGDRQ